MNDENKKLTEKIRWLLLLRVVILSFFLGATALFHFFGTEGDVAYLISLSIPLVLAYVISIISVAVLPKVRQLAPIRPRTSLLRRHSDHRHHLDHRRHRQPVLGSL